MASKPIIEETSATDLNVQEPVAKQSPAATADVDTADVTVATADQSDPLAELNAGFCLMSSPDGATCDAYATDKAGNMRVPLVDAPTMMDHGFTLVTK